jgi:putative transposase
MPRRARLVPPGVPLHLIQRGNNRQPRFLAEKDCRFYLDWLTSEQSLRSHLQVCLLQNIRNTHRAHCFSPLTGFNTF